MTARTVSYLKNTLLAPGQAEGTITALRLEDIPDSFAPWDDSANASGLGAPAILRGTVSTYNLSGLTPGSGMLTAVRQANATALQNAITYCAANEKFFEIVPGTYEIDVAAGLVVPACDGFVWRGEMYHSSIVQFHTNAPVLTLGDIATSTSSNGWDIHGADLSYGVSQSGQTGAQSLVVGQLCMGKVGSISQFNSSFPAYNGFVITAPNLGNFSNIYDNIIVWQVQNDFMRFNNGGTGNIFDNIYLNNGGSFTANLCNRYINLLADTGDWHFRRLNCEWGMTNSVINAPNQTGLKFDTLHIEGITFGGASPPVFGAALLNVATSTVSIDVLDISELISTTNNVINGSACLVQDYVGGSSTVNIKTLTWTNNHPGQLTSNVRVYQPAGNNVDDTPILTVDHGWFRDQTGADMSNMVFFDNNMPLSAFPNTPTKFGRYDYRVGGSIVDRAEIPVSATYTHYGQHSYATLNVPASITSFQITLAATVGATGTRAVPTGTVTRIRRQSGTAAGTLTVKDDAGTTLSTNTASNTDLFYVFNGTHYVTFTPESG